MKRLVILLWLVLLMTACSGLISPSPSLTTLPTQFATPLPSNTTSVSTKLPPSVAPSNTSTVMPSLIPSIQPTLSADDGKELVFGLLKNNGNCELPCMWGLIPNKTKLTELDKFMGNFGETFTLTSYMERRKTDQTGGLTLIYRENGVHIKVYFTYYLNDKSDQIDELSLVADSLFEKGIDPNWLSSTEISVLYGNPTFSQALEYYTLPIILTNYGTPSQILIGTFPNEPDEPSGIFHAFSLVLYYPEQGIFAEYVSPREIDGDYFVGCPTKSHISVGVWSPDNEPPLESIVKRHGVAIYESNMTDFKSVDEATGLTISEFSETFKAKSNITCIKTPIKIWPTIFSQP